MCQALATYVLGPGIEVLGSGPDSGREASFRGRVPYPSSADPWDGFGIVQAKFKERILGTSADATCLRRQVKAELDAWANPGKARVSQGRRPDYLIVATNVPLSGVPGSGDKARIDKLISDYVSQIGLKDSVLGLPPYSRRAARARDQDCRLRRAGDPSSSRDRPGARAHLRYLG